MYMRGLSSLESTPAGQMLADLYLRFLSRQPEPGAIDYWLNNATHGVDVVNAIAFSGENDSQIHQMATQIADAVKSKQIAPITAGLTSIYREYLGREPDEAGLRHWTSLITSDENVLNVLNQIANSPEGKQYRSTLNSKLIQILNQASATAVTHIQSVTPISPQVAPTSTNSMEALYQQLQTQVNEQKISASEAKAKFDAALKELVKTQGAPPPSPVTQYVPTPSTAAVANTTVDDQKKLYIGLGLGAVALLLLKKRS